MLDPGPWVSSLTRRLVRLVRTLDRSGYTFGGLDGRELRRQARELLEGEGFYVHPLDRELDAETADFRLIDPLGAWEGLRVLTRVFSGQDPRLSPERWEEPGGPLGDLRAARTPTLALWVRFSADPADDLTAPLAALEQLDELPRASATVDLAQVGTPEAAARWLHVGGLGRA